MCNHVAHVGHLTPRNGGVGSDDFVRNMPHGFTNDDKFPFDGGKQKIIPRE
jgi:hypothetical protein